MFIFIHDSCMWYDSNIEKKSILIICHIYGLLCITNNKTGLTTSSPFLWPLVLVLWPNRRWNTTKRYRYIATEIPRKAKLVKHFDILSDTSLWYQGIYGIYKKVGCCRYAVTQHFLIVRIYLFIVYLLSTLVRLYTQICANNNVIMMTSKAL